MAKPVDPEKLHSVTSAARALDIPRETLAYAVRRGHCRSVVLASNDVALLLDDVREWLKAERKPGPKPKTAGGSSGKAKASAGGAGVKRSKGTD